MFEFTLQYVLRALSALREIARLQNHAFGCIAGHAHELEQRAHIPSWHLMLELD